MFKQMLASVTLFEFVRISNVYQLFDTESESLGEE